MTAQLWWMLGCDALGLAVLGAALAGWLIPPAPKLPRPGSPAPAYVPAHHHGSGRTPVRVILAAPVSRTGGGAHGPWSVSGTEAQRRLDATMELLHDRLAA